MFEGILNFFRRFTKSEETEEANSKSKAKERLHLVLMQDRANVSADFLEMMKQEIIDVIKKYIVVDESAIDVRLTNQPNTDGTTGAPALYANIPIVNIKNEAKGEKMKEVVGKAEVQENISDNNNQEIIDKVENIKENENRTEVIENVENNTTSTNTEINENDKNITNDK